MTPERIVTIAAIVVAVFLYYIANALIGRRFPSGLRYVRVSGLIYLSVTVMLMFLIRLRPVLSFYQVLWIEIIALGLHLLVLAMLCFILHKFKTTETLFSDKKTSENQANDSSDIESK